jgi:hypothetical protein
MKRLILAAAIRQHVPEDLTALPAFPAGLE